MEELPNTLQCDHCGQTEHLPRIELMEELLAKKAATRVLSAFFAVKRQFGEHGWFTSVGYDLCPDCCKAEGKQPGFVENGEMPETVMIPRNQEQHEVLNGPLFQVAGMFEIDEPGWIERIDELLGEAYSDR